MAAFAESITFNAITHALELSPSGGQFTTVSVKRAVMDSAGGGPSSWVPCFSDRKIDLHKSQNVEKIRRAMKLPTDQTGLILAIIERYEQSLAEGAAVEQKKKSGFKLHIRGRNMPETTATPIEGDSPFAAIQNALNMAPADLPDEALIMVPKEIDQVAFLDIDYHSLPIDQRPDERDLDAMMNTILPCGVFAFASHGRGLKMIFVRQEGLGAKVLADCAASYAHLVDPRCDTEVSNTCRHPAMPRGEQRCGPVRELIPDETIAIIGFFNRFACPPDIADKFRIDNGWQIGQRYGHEKCPIDPTHISGSPNPIVALDHGIYCHSCNGRHGDGYRSWGQLAGLVAENDNPIYTAARHRAHWNHVQYIFREIKIDS
ncbi:MAG TPA: hypothetical protein VKX17_18905 [Planctomycetota bacterium]|nr:hypothetical protein [Planctomycetota bacterium]